MFILSRGGICLLIWKTTKCNDKIVGKRGAMTCRIVKKCYTSKETDDQLFGRLVRLSLVEVSSIASIS